MSYNITQYIFLPSQALDRKQGKYHDESDEYHDQSEPKMENKMISSRQIEFNVVNQNKSWLYECI